MKLEAIAIIILSLVFIEITSGQVTWEAVNLPSDGFISELEIGPKNDIYITVGTGGFFDWHDSIFCSKDNGISWNYIDLGKNMALNDICISPQDEIYVGTGSWGGGGGEPPGGIFYSSDGLNFEHIHINEPSCGHIYKVFLNHDGDLLAVTDMGSLFQIKANEEEWEVLCSCDFVEGGCGPYTFKVNDLMIDSLNQYYISTSMGLFQSSDKGSTWKDLGLDFDIQCAEFYDNLELVAGTDQNGIFHYNDDSDTWVNIGLKKMKIRTIFSQGNSTLFVSTQESGVFYTNNNGETWGELNQGLDKKNILSMKISPSGFFYISAGGQETWEETNLPTGSKLYKSVESFEGIYPTFQLTGNHGTPENQNLKYLLKQNFPNPFSGQTNITFIIQEPQNIKLSIYNSYGELIETLVDEYKVSGSHCISWDAGIHSPGVYFYRIETKEYLATKTLILL